MIVNKKENLLNPELYCPGWPQNKIERNQKEGLVPGPCFETVKAMKHESDGNTNCNWYSWYSHQKIDKSTCGLRNKKRSGDHRTYCIIELGQYTEKSPVDLRILVVTQTPVRNHRLTLIWKTQKGVYNNNYNDNNNNNNNNNNGPWKTIIISSIYFYV